MHSGRLFEIIYLLMERHQMTAAELAGELEVSTRTIRRDIEALSSAGVPVYMTRGRSGGVHLLPHYVLDKSVLSHDEQTEILTALSALRSTGVSDSDTLHTRFARLFQRENTDWVDIDFSFWHAPTEYKEAFESIKQAILSCHLLRFEYYDLSGKVSIRTVEPARLVFKESSWYLRAYCLTRNAWRTFKLFRINWKNMETLPETFEMRPLPPPIDASTSSGNTTHLRLLFSSHAEHRIREEFAPKFITPQDKNNFLVELDLCLNERFAYYLLSYGSDVEVLEPTSLRQQLEQEARAIVARYCAPSSSSQ